MCVYLLAIPDYHNSSFLPASTCLNEVFRKTSRIVHMFGRSEKDGMILKSLKGVISYHIQLITHRLMPQQKHLGIALLLGIL
jgi:hypothetical protein